jgi:hypothetical protein
VRLPEQDLMTSINACLYSEHAGLNETFIFNSIDGKDLTGFSYEVFDWEYLAGKEKRAKQKRLMLTPDFSEWKTQARVQGVELMEGSKPRFAATTRNYNSLGGEKVDKKATEAKAQEEQSFFSKYWMYIIAALFILPRILGVEENAPA